MFPPACTVKCAREKFNTGVFVHYCGIVLEFAYAMETIKIILKRLVKDD